MFKASLDGSNKNILIIFIKYKKLKYTMAKNKFWSFRNPLITLKAIATSVIAGLLVFVPLTLLWFFINNTWVMGITFNILGFVVWLFVWGFFANKLWKWK